MWRTEKIFLFFLLFFFLSAGNITNPPNHTHHTTPHRTAPSSLHFHAIFLDNIFSFSPLSPLLQTMVALLASPRAPAPRRRRPNGTTHMLRAGGLTCPSLRTTDPGVFGTPSSGMSPHGIFAVAQATRLHPSPLTQSAKTFPHSSCCFKRVAAARPSMAGRRAQDMSC